MPFGRRRFDRVILVDGVPSARFLPFDMGADIEVVDEASLRRAIADNGYAAIPVLDVEEALALSALECFAKNNENQHPTRSALAKQRHVQQKLEP